jgi:predicted hotdog family 3-hydroxylacyl-ACP dehydratase
MNPYLSYFQHPVYSGDDILALIPQRKPIVLIDKFFGVNNCDSFSGLTVREDNLFCRNGILTEEGVIEHFAQSAAARIGFLFVQNNEPVPVGFIGAVSKFTVYAHPQAGRELLTVVGVIREVGNITLAEARSWVGDELIAEGELKIYLDK